MGKQPPIIELNTTQLEDVLQRVGEGQLNAEDAELIKLVFGAYIYLFDQLRNKSISIHRFRKMLFGASTEKTSAVLGDETDEKTPSSDETNPAESSPEADAASNKRADRPRRKGHGRNGADAYPGAERIWVPHASLQPGDACPDCGSGTLYNVSRFGTLVRIVGQAPVYARVYELQKLRCNPCGKIFTAAPPEGVGTEKHDATVGSMIGLLRYGNGMPNNRQGNVQKNLGVPLPASTQWDIVDKKVVHLEPAYEELIRQAAQDDVMHGDDTTIKIQDWMGKGGRERRKKAVGQGFSGEDNEKLAERSGMFTTGMVTTRGDRAIALFFTGPKHAGENLKDVLHQRAKNLQAPIQMCDAADRNLPDGFETILANCLAHGRRRFVDVLDYFPEQCRYVLEALRIVYRNDATAREQRLTPQQRLQLHQTESGPVMAELHAWLQRQFAQRLVEPNSSLGGAIGYLLKHWMPLTLFLRVPGAPLDNNICEQALKRAIRHRKNSLFYKTPRGAHVGDVFMSLIHTCELYGANAFDYLTELERHTREVSANPAAWMPWNYRQTLAAAITSGNAATVVISDSG